MRNRGKKLAVFALCVICTVTQAIPAHATEGAGMTGHKADILALQETVFKEKAVGVGEGQEPNDEENMPDESGEQPPDTPENVPGDPDHPQEPDDPNDPDNPDNPDHPQPPDEPENPVPEKPTGLRMTCQSDTKVLIEWDGSDDADSYEVYRKTGSGSYKMLDTVKKARYTDKSVVYGKIYRYRIIPLNKEGEPGAAAGITFSHKQVVNITKQKYTYQEMQDDMQKLAKTYDSYCGLSSIGTSVKGRAIYDFAIGNPDAKKSLLVVSTLHAREYVCSAMLMREIEYYLRNYNRKISGTKPAELLKNMQIHYIVMANPDGVTISQTTHPRWKSNSRGVDLNRNFPAKKFNVGGKKGSEGYSGKKALSEPESKAVAAFTKNLQGNQGLLGVVNYHAMGQIIYGDCISGSAKLKKNTQKMYRIANSLTGYRSAGNNTSRGNTIGGQYREYVMYMLGLPSITLEVGATWAPCAFWEYNSVYQKNRLVVLKIAEAL